MDLYAPSYLKNIPPPRSLFRVVVEVSFGVIVSEGRVDQCESRIVTTTCAAAAMSRVAFKARSFPDDDARAVLITDVACQVSVEPPTFSF